MKLKLKMKSLGLEDVDYIMTWVNDQEVVKNLQHFTKEYTREDEKQYVQKILNSKNDFVFSFFDPALTVESGLSKSTGEYVGQGGIHQIAWDNKLGRLSIIIKREYWNKGYAQEILPRLIDHGFKKLGLHKIWLMHWKENEKAGHLYKKLGFIQEGILKDEYYWQDKYHDMVRMAIINQEN